MSLAVGFKRLGFALVAVIAAGGSLLYAANALIPADSVRTQVLAQLRAATGLKPVLRGPTTVSLFPSEQVSFADVVLGDGDQPALTARRLTARLRFFPLLIGKIEIADLSLERPTIVIDLKPTGGSNWSTLIDALASSQTANVQGLGTFSEMRITGGTLVLRDPVHELTEQLDDVEASLAWPSISKSFGATGRFMWHGEPVDASLTLADFAATLAGKRSGVKLRLASTPMKGAFEGTISLAPTVKIEGSVAADSKSLRNALIWLGQKPLPGGGFQRFAIKARTDVMGGTIALTGVSVELDGNTAEGVLTFALDGRKTLQGTLASETLDLSPYVSTVRLLTANEREWNSSPITLDGLNGMDVDLRLSAANLVVGDAKVGRTAIAANLRGGQLVVTIGESQAYGGVIKGAVTLANIGTGIELKSQLQFTDVELNNALAQLFGLHRVEGKGNIAFSAEGSGDSVLAVARTLAGTAELTAANGALVGLNVEQLLRRLERRPLSGGGEFRNGRTPFDKLNVSLRIAQGIAKVEDMTIVGPTVKVVLTGSASIPARELDLSGTAALVAASRAGAQPFELPFVVQGSWDDPAILPDAEALLRRSGAAAPLLNAVRERSARDTVRSALERLTGAAPAQPPPAATEPDAPLQ
ncbi:MAG: AsmA family protein [Pseudolabrys sp.]|nr:AsmA family protein [Pseudolabrys sp.]